MFKKVLILTLVALSFGVLIKDSCAKDYPTRPIEVYVPYAAGNSSDIMSRKVADSVQKLLGQPVVVVNKPGAGGTLAAGEVVNSKPDGYKLLCVGTSMFSFTSKTQKIPFDLNALSPLANFMEFVELGVVKGDSEWKTLYDMLDYARKNPRKLKWAHIARGSIQHVMWLLLFKKAGVETTDVPYPQGDTEKLNAVIGGHVDLGVVAYGTAKDQITVGRVKALFYNGERRYEPLPQVPCSVELGFPECAKLETLVGWYIHKDTPDDIKKILSDALKKISEDPELKHTIERLGGKPRFVGPEVIKESIKRAEEFSIPALKELGLYVGQ